MGGFYTTLSMFGFPIACMGMLTMFSINSDLREQIYLDTPSIPYQPYCEFSRSHAIDDYRPIKGINEISSEFLTILHEEFIRRGIWVRRQPRYIEYPKKMYVDTVFVPPPPRIISTYDMIDPTRDALYRINGEALYVNGEERRSHKGIYTLDCKDIEGKITKF